MGSIELRRSEAEAVDHSTCRHGGPPRVTFNTSCHRRGFHFTWDGIREDTRAFITSCLLYIMTKSGSTIPRPISSTLHGSKPNEVLHFDYLFLDTFSQDEMYVLVLKDDFSGHCWLSATNSACSEHDAKTSDQWTRTFSSPAYWVSDQGGILLLIIWVRTLLVTRS